MRSIVAVQAALLSIGCAKLAIQSGAWKPSFTQEGVARVSSFELPPSSYMSPEAVERLKQRATPSDSFPGFTIEGVRESVERTLAPMVAAAMQRYPVDIAPVEIAGVKTQIITPKNGESDRARILINLHGGAFMMCAGGCPLVESIPIAAVARIKVVTVDYRQGPEHRFPAATEDVVAVYKSLLNTYRPEAIGIYGCSAGGSLAAQSQAWFQRERLPSPGALGIFGAGAIRSGAGDSAYIASRINGSFPPPADGKPVFSSPYFEGVNLEDPLVSPAFHPEVLAKFPPTLVITGTRAPDLSPAVVTHTALVKAGVPGDLIVAEGMGHCFLYDVGLPESRDAYDIIARFFDEHLGANPQ
jgi:acetyl esterase/lipase